MATVADRMSPTLPRWQRLLLPAVLGADHADRGQAGASRLPRSLRDWLVDIVFFLGAAGLAAASALGDHGEVPTAMFVLDVGLGLVALGALWVRRRSPWAVGVFTIAASAVSGAAGGAAVVALFSAVLYCTSRRALVLFGAALAAGAIEPALYPDGRQYNTSLLIFGVFVNVVAVAFGAFVRARRELVLSLQERNRQLQADQQRRVAEARQAERTRIAREMHDVLAHRISLLSVHAGALEFNPDASPAEISRAATVIRESARAAQEELREVIGVLRAEPAVAADDVEPPQPTLDELSRLVEESRRAGMEVRLAIALSPRRLPPTLGRTVYRFVQEALTNVRKHAPEQIVSIVVAGGGHTGVRVSVTNQPPVGRAVSGPLADHVGSGTGLIGLRERVVLAGGTLEHGPLPGGGFRLCATLPWREEITP